MKQFRNMLWGLVLVFVGVIFGLNALDITDINIFFDGWWTLFIIIPCFISLFKEENRTGDLIGLGIGVSLLLCCQDVLDFDMVWKLLVPAILIIIGLSFIFRDTFNSKVKKEIKKINANQNSNPREFCATFSGQKADFTNEEFDGCELTSVFGGVTCDLRDAIIKKDSVITVSAIFGGVDIYVPKDVVVKITSSSVFGGVSNSRKDMNSKDSKDMKIIYVNATCVFGGVEIK